MDDVIRLSADDSGLLRDILTKRAPALPGDMEGFGGQEWRSSSALIDSIVDVLSDTLATAGCDATTGRPSPRGLRIEDLIDALQTGALE